MLCKYIYIYIYTESKPLNGMVYNVTKAYLFQVNAELWIFLFIKQSCKKYLCFKCVLNIDKKDRTTKKTSSAEMNQLCPKLLPDLLIMTCMNNVWSVCLSSVLYLWKHGFLGDKSLCVCRAAFPVSAPKHRHTK